MAAIPLTGNSPHKEETKYHGKYGHALGLIQHIALISRIDIFTNPFVCQTKL